jgi:hypothetical protein
MLDVVKSYQFLISFLHEHGPHHIRKYYIQNSGAAIAQLILLKTVENDTCNLSISL